MNASNGGVGGALLGQVREDLARGPAEARRGERRTWIVAALSLAVMAGELTGGAWLNSLALSSDGLHTATHAGVLLIAAAAYALARRRASPAEGARTLNTAALVSGVLLALVAVALGVESVERLFHPQPVRFVEAAGVTAAGLLLGLVSALLLRNAHTDVHVEGGAHAHGRDLNLWAAYLHMLADVVTSVLALLALGLGAVTGWSQLDSAVGVLNTVIVAGFSMRLLTAARRALKPVG